jgi:hypothetical protein
MRCPKGGGAVNALALLTQARELGITMRVEGSKLILEGDALGDELIASFKAAKPEVIRLLTSVPEATTTEKTMDSTIGAAMGSLCDGCQRVTAVALVTDYNGRFCRACLDLPETTMATSRPELEPYVPAEVELEPIDVIDLCEHLARVRPGSCPLADEVERLADTLAGLPPGEREVLVGRLWAWWKAEASPSLSVFLAGERPAQGRAS